MVAAAGGRLRAASAIRCTAAVVQALLSPPAGIGRSALAASGAAGRVEGIAWGARSALAGSAAAVIGDGGIALGPLPALACAGIAEIAERGARRPRAALADSSRATVGQEH